MAYVQMAAALGLGGLSLAIFRLAYRLMRYDRVEYEKSRARYPSMYAAISGKAEVRRSDVPDGRVRAGIVYNKKHNRIETNGKIRNDVIDHVF
ncbi:hypothetical protein [Mesorhizobium sp. Mes31]|uniref:hypothetical protein n=1 Tax=Mesorhizobium sp. Mes31 TaxID=2926017 RepID=UPI0021183A81|nr:hypothetical protein [Mesorhizobium sp. Mes31]